jgi:hypothetical protein
MVSADFAVLDFSPLKDAAVGPGETPVPADGVADHIGGTTPCVPTTT